jgi:hypothetical protein
MRDGELDDVGLLEAGAQILEGLAEAHRRGIVHRDVKPANVLLEEGPEVSVRILDFGLALINQEETLTAPGDIPGTLAYISPERLRGEPAGPATDVWSVGVLLWEGLAGQHPFWGGSLLETGKRIAKGAPSLATARPDLPRPIVELVDRALALDPRKRPEARKLATALRRAADARTRRRKRRRIRVSFPAVSPSRLAPAIAAALFAGWTTVSVPFYPSAWPPGIAFVVGALTFFSPRAGLALALVVPVFPLGNVALALAILYAAAAAAWLCVSWREPRSAFLLVLGPLLAPVGSLGLLPLAAQVVRSPVRRAMQVAVGVLAASVVAGIGRLDTLRLDGSRQPLTTARTLWQALHADSPRPLLAVALAAVALGLPYVRGRGPWPVAAFGAAMLALTVVPTRGTGALPFVATAWITCALLAFEPAIRSSMTFARRG